MGIRGPNQKKTPTLKLSLRLLQDARPYWWHLGLVFLLTLSAAPISLLTPIPMKLAVDNAIDGKPFPFLFRWLLPASWQTSSNAFLVLVCALSLLFLLMQTFQGYLAWVYQLYVGEKLVALSRARLFSHVQRLSLKQHDEQGVPDLLYRLQNDIVSMQYLAIWGLIPFFTSSVTFLSMLFVTLRLDWEFAGLAIGVLPLLWGISRLHAPRSRASWKEVKESERSAISVIQEVLGSIRVVKAFAQEDREENRYKHNAEINIKRHLQAVWIETVFGMVITTIVAIATSAALYIGVRHVQSGALSLGNLLVIMAYLAQLFRPL